MPSKESLIQKRIFNILLFFTFFVSAFFVIEGIYVRTDILDNWKWFLSMAVVLVIYFYCKHGQCIALIKHIFFIYLIFFMLPIGWMSSPSNSPFNIGYVFILILSISYFYTGTPRFALSGSVIIISTMLLAYQSMYPERFIIYSKTELLINIIIQVPLTLLIAVFMLSKFADTLNLNNKVLETLSTHDELTGIYNRRFIYGYLDKIQLTASREHPAYVGLIDVDNFKYINDTFGHDTGDKVMKKVANHIKRTMNHSGLVGRYGGDEFIVIFTECDHIPCQAIALKMKNLSLLQKELSLENPVTISGGFAIFDGSKTMDEVLALADKRLYVAKHEGKNKIVFH